MKKYTINPDDYAAILQSIEINNIRLSEGSIKVTDKNMPGGTISLAMDEKYSFVDFREIVSFKSTFKLLGCPEDSNDKKSAFFEIKATYTIDYTKENPDVEIGKDFFDVFRDTSLKSMIWPYFREYVQSNLVRACIAPVVLPLRKWRM